MSSLRTFFFRVSRAFSDLLDNREPLRAPLSLSSRAKSDQLKVKPGQNLSVTASPQRGNFQIDRIEILSPTPSNWIVLDVLVGHRSQLAQSGPLNGAAFDAASRSRILLEPCGVAMDVEIVVSYIGPDPDGEVFDAVAFGAFDRPW